MMPGSLIEVQKFRVIVVDTSKLVGANDLAGAENLGSIWLVIGMATLSKLRLVGAACGGGESRTQSPSSFPAPAF